MATVEFADPNTLDTSRFNLSGQIESERQQQRGISSAADFGTYFPGEPPIQDQADLDLRMNRLLTDTTPGATVPDDILRQYRDYRRGRLEPTFAYLDQGMARNAADEHRSQINLWDKAFSGPEKVASLLPADQKPAFDAVFANSLRPDEEKKQTVNMLFVENATGHPVDPANWSVMRSQFSAQNFGTTTPVDESTFYKLAGDYARKEKSDYDMSDKVSRIATETAMQALPLAEASRRVKEATGYQYAQFEPVLNSAYSSMLARYSNDILRTSNDITRFSAITEGSDVNQSGESPTEGLAVAYNRLSQEDRFKALGLAAANAQAQGQTIDGFIERVGGGLVRGVKPIFLGIDAKYAEDQASSLQAILDKGQVSTLSKGDFIQNPSSFLEEQTRLHINQDFRDITPEENKKAQLAIENFQGQAKLLRDLSAHSVDIARYRDDHIHFTWRSIDDGLVMMAESAPTMLVSALPGGIGLAVLGETYAQRNRSLLEEAGGKDTETDRAVALAEGIGEAGIDRLEWLTLGAKMPAVSAYLLKFGKAGVLANYAVKTGLKATAEFGQEIAQDLSFPATQSIVSALNTDIQGPNWAETLQKEKDSLGDLAAVSLGLSIIGEVGSSIGDHMEANKLRDTLMDRRGLQIAGYDLKTSNEIAQAAENNPLRAAELLKHAQMTTSAEDRFANSRRAFQRIQAESSIQSLEQAGIAVPYQNADGSVTVRQNGQDQKFASMDEAITSMRAREQADNVSRSELNQQMVDYLQKGQEEDSPWKFAANLDSPVQTLEQWAGESEDRRKQAYNRAQIYLREGGYDMGLADDLSKFVILGSNRNEYARGLATTVADISEKGNPMTVLEERGEGYWKYILDSERLGPEQGLQWVRQFEVNSGKDFLPDDFGSKEASLQQQDVIEALSTISVSHALGKIEESQVPAPLRKFFQGVKEVISDVLNLAGLVKTLVADSKLDEEFVRHLNVAAGVDVNGEFESARLAANSQLLGDLHDALQQELQNEISHNQDFSVVLESDPLVAQILNQAKGTEEQIAVFEKLADTAREINARTFDNYNFDRDLADLNQREHAEIIAARDKILAKYGEDIANGTNKQKIADIQRQTEGRIRDRYANEREKLQNRQETAQDRFEKQRDIALLESIAKTLPAEIRGRLVGDFRALDQLQTPQARERYLIDLLPKVQAGLEEHLQDQYREAIGKLFEKGQVKVSDARTRGGKIGAEGHDIFDEARKAQPLTIKQVDAATEPLRQQMESQALSEQELAVLDAKVAAIELFGDYDNADASRLKDAHALLQGVYQEGREQWLGIIKSRSDVRRERVDTLIRGVGGDPSRSLTDIERNSNRTPGFFKKFDEGVMAAFISGSQTLRRLGEATNDPAVKGIVEQMEYAFLESELMEGDMNRADEHALKLAMQSIFQTRSVYGVSKKLHELSQQGITPVEKLEGRVTETVSVPKNIVESLLSGEVNSFESKGEKIELRDKDRASLQAASDQFDKLPEKQQNRKRNITFGRTLNEGQRMTLGQISQLEGLQLWLTMRQPDQFSKLERMGYDQETMDQLTAWLKPETQALGLWMVQHIGADTFTLDNLHRMEKGVGLKLVDQYFPVRNDVARAQNGDLSLDGNAPQFTGKSAGFVKERVKNNAAPAYVNAVAVFMANRAQVNFWKSHVANLREWGGIIKDERFAATIKAKMGTSYYDALNTRLSRIESGGALNAKRALQMEALVRNMTRNFALGTLGLRASTIAVNLSAGLNFTLEMPITEIAKGAAELAANPKAFADAFTSPAIQRRWKEGATYEAKIAKSTGPSAHPALATLNSWAEHGLAPINWADTGAQLVGSAIAYEHARKAAIASGLSEDEAKVEANKRVERLLLRAAQPTTRLAKSELELSLAENPLAAMGTMFFSDPRKNLAILYLAGREILTGKGTNGKGLAAQQLLVGGLVLGATEFLIRSSYQALVKADDSDDPDFGARWLAKVTDPKAWLYALSTNQLKSVPVAGEAFNQMMAKITDQKAFAQQNPLSGAVGKAAQEVAKLTADDTKGKVKTREDIIDGAIKVVQGFGSAIPGGAIFSQAANAAEFLEGLNSSNGISVSDAERVKRVDSRFGKFEKELNAKLGKTEDENGKVNKSLKRQKDQAKADQLDALLQPLSPELRKQALEKIEPSKDVVGHMKFKVKFDRKK